jgi:golgi SNAP receptor complex member 1
MQYINQSPQQSSQQSKIRQAQSSTIFDQMKVPSTAWEELRKEARKLENEIDANLASMLRLTGVSTTINNNTNNSNANRNNNINFDLIHQKEQEIEALLTRLSDVTRALNSSINSSSSSSTTSSQQQQQQQSETAETTASTAIGSTRSIDTRMHTLQRHKDVQLEFNLEFRRLKEYIEQERDHASLLSGRYRVGGSLENQAGGDGSTNSNSAAMRERNSILNSSIAVDDAIGSAQNTASALYEQRGIFNNTISALASAGSKIPMVNNLLVAIKRKKNKDAIVLSAVCAICTALVLLYWMAK